MMDNNDLLVGVLSTVYIQELLSALSGKPITWIKLVCQEKELPDVFDKFGVFPNIYIEDSTGICYTIKYVQQEEKYLERLGRCLQSAVDKNYIAHGGSIQDLPESYTILVWSYDHYRAELAVYAIQDSFAGIDVSDGHHVMILNSHYCTPNAAPQVITFLNHIRESESTKQPNKIR